MFRSVYLGTPIWYARALFHSTVDGFAACQLKKVGQLLRRIVKRSPGGLVVKAHRLLYQSTLGSRVTKQKKNSRSRDGTWVPPSTSLTRFIWAHQFGAPGLFSAPTLTNLHCKRCMST